MQSQYYYTDCTSGAGDDLGVAVDGRNCGLDNPRALAYSPMGSEECSESEGFNIAHNTNNYYYC